MSSRSCSGRSSRSWSRVHLSTLGASWTTDWGTHTVHSPRIVATFRAALPKHSDPSLTQAAFDELNLNPSEFLNSWTLNKAVTVSLQ